MDMRILALGMALAGCIGFILGYAFPKEEVKDGEES